MNAESTFYRDTGGSINTYRSENGDGYKHGKSASKSDTERPTPTPLLGGHQIPTSSNLISKYLWLLDARRQGTPTKGPLKSTYQGKDPGKSPWGVDRGPGRVKQPTALPFCFMIFFVTQEQLCDPTRSPSVLSRIM